LGDSGGYDCIGRAGIGGVVGGLMGA